ncbi:MAG TPA: tetratricopeptide repeat protein [Sumerlaeia bacterium]|nr:tetratricopeptide repeat protein [Sumerlaeia bacterium]
MDERLLAAWRFFETHTRAVTLAVALVLFGAVFSLYFTEGSTDIPPPPPPPASSTSGESRGSAETIASAVASPVKPFGETDFAPLIHSSMFNVKDIQTAIQQEAQANAVYEEAARLFDAGKYKDALEACEKALAHRPMHFKSRELKAKIEGILNPAPTPTPVPSGAGVPEETRLPARF